MNKINSNQMMKNVLIFICTIILLSSCDNTPERPEPVMTQAQHDKVNQETAVIQAQKAAQAAQATSMGVGLHYSCPNHPASGGDTQGTCSICGNAFVHNQAYHNTTTADATATPPGAEPPINASGVYHYTCPNGHSGGSGSADSCGECGATRVHNQAYHDTSGASPTAAATPPAAEPPINAAGVYHYTCPNGHSGGSGSADSCGECGATRVHNQAYHN